MDFVSGLLYGPVNEKKKNDDMIEGETLLVINRTRSSINILYGKHIIPSGEEERIPFTDILSFTVGAVTKKISFKVTPDTDILECYYTNTARLTIQFSNNVLTCTSIASKGHTFKIVNRSNVNLTVLYLENTTPVKLKTVVVSAKTFLPVRDLHCIYDDEGTIIYCSILNSDSIKSRFRITSKNDPVLSGSILTITEN